MLRGRHLIGALMALLGVVLGGAAHPETPGLPAQCTPVATVIYTDCVVEIASRCDSQPEGWRLYERYSDGAPVSRVLREDGLFIRAMATASIYRTFDYPAGMTPRLLAGGAGTEDARDFKSAQTAGQATTRESGHQVVRHGGTTWLDLASGPVEVVIIEANGDVETGRHEDNTRFYEPVLKIVLGSDWRVTFPDRPTQTGREQALWLLLPGDPGYGEVSPPQSRRCGPAS